MLRLVLTHQLVLALLVGPMLCCCTAARLGHGSPHTSLPNGKSKSNDKSKPKHCCGSQSSDSGQSAPGDKPAESEKCPCKNAPQAVVAMPEQAATSADVLTQFAAGLATLNHSVTPFAPAFTGRPTTSFGARSSNLSTDDILYAHHNLRC